MPDLADMAEGTVEIYSTPTQRTEFKIIPTGHCHYCEAPTQTPKLFCDGECAEEYETMKKQQMSFDF